MQPSLSECFIDFHTSSLLLTRACAADEISGSASMRLLRLARQACAVQNTSNCSAVILLHVQYSESVCSSGRTGYVFFGTLVCFRNLFYGDLFLFFFDTLSKHWKMLNIDYSFCLKLSTIGPSLRSILTIDGCFNCVTSHVTMLGWLEKKKGFRSFQVGTLDGHS